ncbi:MULTISPECIES: sulfite exporter TauE/SafE family protein [Sanguibacteroides]|nr:MULTISPECIES: sulfite exporter TauE/SafE family protein [Sanguibacteroides]
MVNTMIMSLTEALITILLGTAAGFINTFAGGGSMLVVPFLIFIGLPANVANATNRVAILFQNIVSVGSFKQKKILDFKTDSKLLLPVALGSIVGAFIAVDINEEIFRKVIAGLLIVMFFMLWLDPNSWVKANAERAKVKNPWLRHIVFFIIGIYGGFIQIGIGFFLLAGLVLGCGYDLLKANAIKLFIVLFYTIIALGIFFYYGLVDLKTGLILACGNMLGAWIGIRFSIKWGAKYIRYFLLVILLIVAVRLYFT